ncbi:SRPBCC family protein [Nitriliruptoraceae bacterium ZYF776]|nr:SRPBCC family protein [Profundirhabdus halotolerans]
MPTCRPETSAFVATAPLRAHASRQVPAAPDEVFAVLADAPGWSRWFPGLSSATWTSPAPHGVGSTRTVRVGPARVDERFVVWEPGARFGFTFTGSNLPVARAGVELVELVDIGDGRTRVSYTMAVEPFGVPRPLGRLATPVLAATIARGLAGLERHLTRNVG